MANIADDTSVGRDSVFDWGGKDGTNNVRMSSIIPSTSRSNSNRSNNSGGGGGGGDDSEPSSRYDPTAMSRIVDITDLVDDEDDSSMMKHPSDEKRAVCHVIITLVPWICLIHPQEEELVTNVD